MIRGYKRSSDLSQGLILSTDEEIFAELRGAQELGRAGILDCTSERHNSQCDKAGHKKMEDQLGYSVAEVSEAYE